jgi:prephenate dehydrogenase
MKIGIVGLGLMGASFAKGFGQYHVIGYDQQPAVMKQAFDDGVIHEQATSMESLISQSDWILVCLYPLATKEFFVSYKDHFKPGQIISDIAGVKALFDDLVPNEGVDYVFIHPIAGRAKAGYQHHDVTMFKGANCIITTASFNQSENLIKVESLLKELGFGSITRMSMKEHDQRIAYTSQLTHAIAVGLMNTAKDLNFAPIIGDSYRDLTRIARINEVMWSELFLLNQEALTLELDEFIQQMVLIRNAVAKDMQEELEGILKRSRIKREQLP